MASFYNGDSEEFLLFVRNFNMTPSTPLMKVKHDDKSDKDFVKLKLCRDLMSEKSDLYDFKTAFFENGDPEEVLLFVCNLNTTLAALGTLEMAMKVQ